MRHVVIGSSKLELVQGDITDQDTEAIVNAANTTLLGGGGVDGAIHRRGGPSILQECEQLGGCATGDAKITGAGRLKARYVIHAVGPVYHDGKRGEADVLASTYRRSFEVASEHRIASLSFPSISTGAYRFPVRQAASVGLGTVLGLLRGETGVALVRFVLFSAADLACYEAILEELAPAVSGSSSV